MITLLYTIPFAVKETPHSAHKLNLYVLCDSPTKGDCDPKRHTPTGLCNGKFVFSVSHEV